MLLHIEQAQRLAGSLLAERRFRHSAGVAKMAAELAMRYGLDPQKAAYAGWAHDIAKELPLARQSALAERYQLLLYPEDQGLAEVLHGRLAAYWLQTYYRCEDADVLAAIEHHTLGRPGMSDLELLIFSADKIEENRWFPEVDNLRQALYDNLKQGAFACMEHGLRHLEATQCPVHSLTYAAYDDLKERLNIGS
ncbi:MAG: bis(5'-nucleosyl)-tetraphosphatase (symmetrical) YqeK [Peptococcaceae bacterium]|nr:bis(5'-nucleosyl)-tetraphosphatase (symmetrical) YqeK [Peptococcaceae bacterium]